MKYLRTTLFVLAVVLLLSASPTFLLAGSTFQTGDEPVAPPLAPEMLDTSIPPMEGGAPYPFPIVAYDGPLAPATPAATDAPAITVWNGNNQTFGQLGTPQQWINILGNVTGATTLTYSLNGGLQRSLSIGSDGTRLYGAGDFNIELDYSTLKVLPETNTVTIVAANGAATDVEVVTVSYQPGIIPSLPSTTDWSVLPSVQAGAQAVDGQWSINGGKVGPTVPGYDRLLAIGDMSWKDYEVTVPITVHSLNTNDLSNSAGVGLIARWRGHFQVGSEQPAAGWRKLGTLTWFRWNQAQEGAWEMRGNGGSYLVQSTQKPLEFGKTYIFKLSVQSSTLQGEPSTYRFKVWESGQPEPMQWFMKSVGSLNEPDTGSLLLVAHQAMVSFGNVTVKPIQNKTFTIQVDQPANGTISVEPEEADGLYDYGQTVEIRAQGTGNYVLKNWTFDFSGNENPLVFDIGGNVKVGAVMEVGEKPKLTVTTVGSGKVTVSPLRANNIYFYGEEVTMTPQPNPGSIFAGWSGDLTGAENPAVIVMDRKKTITANFITADATSPVSDDFTACALDTSLWTFINPVGDGSYEMNGTQLRLIVPAGPSHNIWENGNRSVRVMQPTKNVNFEIITKFDSVVTQRYQMQGVLVEQSSSDYLRFETHHDGTHVKLYVARFKNGNPSAVINNVFLTSTPAYMRITRAGPTWGVSYSYDGSEWLAAGSFNFDMTVTQTGVFGGNHATASAPAHTAVVDYFFNSASPIEPQDGSTASFKVNVTKVGQGNVTLNPSKAGYACGEKVTLTAVPANGWRFSGWSGDLSGSGVTQQLVISRNHQVTASFVVGPTEYKIYLPISIKQ